MLSNKWLKPWKTPRFCSLYLVFGQWISSSCLNYRKKELQDEHVQNSPARIRDRGVVVGRQFCNWIRNWRGSAKFMSASSALIYSYLFLGNMDNKYCKEKQESIFLELLHEGLTLTVEGFRVSSVKISVKLDMIINDGGKSKATTKRINFSRPNFLPISVDVKRGIKLQVFVLGVFFF